MIVYLRQPKKIGKGPVVAIEAVTDNSEVLDMVSDPENPGLAFGAKIRAWVKTLRQDPYMPPMSVGNGQGRTEVDCDSISQSEFMCDKIKEVVASEIDIEAKKLEDFLIYLLEGQLSSALQMTPYLGGYQIYEWRKEFEALGGTAATYGPVVSFGGGGGGGFQIRCGKKMLISAGGGGGGGVEILHDQGPSISRATFSPYQYTNSGSPGSTGYSGGTNGGLATSNADPAPVWHADYEGGGGGGVTIFPVGQSEGVSVGCGSNGTFNRFDDGVDVQKFLSYLPEVLEILRTCPSQDFHMHGGGGGGGGISLKLPSPNMDASQEAISTYNLGYFYFYFDDAQAETGSEADSCSHIPCSQWVHFAQYIRGGPCAAGNVTCTPDNGEPAQPTQKEKSVATKGTKGHDSSMQPDYWSTYGQGFKQLGIDDINSNSGNVSIALAATPGPSDRRSLIGHSYYGYKHGHRRRH
eukprot:CAMPEP_0184481462 /NCGR_PEP_ID=MMETSP0113_2-20130426/3003_1 /TAXON_ID=91329 /ORGANISM="Norrisiella sphaerica, Strain BC52" /LENGTH=464 /DNA_ID=CAMNT_0026860597 /DNA_START=34 /DNA_END=1428 /DNA_ORIENTATION=+